MLKKKRQIMSQKSSSPVTMSFGGHLRELKMRFLFCLILFAIAFGVCFSYQQIIFDYFLQLGKGIGFNFVYISPEEVVVQQLKLVSLCAFLITLPFAVLQLCLYVSVGLRSFTRFLVVLYGVFSLFFYVLGSYFAIKILLPSILSFLFKANTSELVSGSVSVGNFISFSVTIISSLGLIFEMPVVSCLLAFCGILTVKILRSIRSYIIVLIFVVAAVVTPPEVVSQLIVAVPMIALYELSIVVVFLITRIRGRKQR